MARNVKNNERINYFIKRQAILEMKLKNANEKQRTSMQEEYNCLIILINTLKLAKMPIKGMVTTSDGYIVNNFRREKYEKALARFKELHEINNLYITDEEEQNFRFEEVDFEALNREVDNISTSTELMEMRKKVYNLMEYQTEEMQEKIKETIIKRLDDMLVSASFIDKQNNIGTRENEKNIASKCKSFREKFKVQVHSIKKMQNIAKDIKHNRGIER